MVHVHQLSVQSRVLSQRRLGREILNMLFWKLIQTYHNANPLLGLQLHMDSANKHDKCCYQAQDQLTLLFILPTPVLLVVELHSNLIQQLVKTTVWGRTHSSMGIIHSASLRQYFYLVSRCKWFDGVKILRYQLADQESQRITLQGICHVIV